MDANKFGSFLTQLRKEQNMTQAELAEKLQVTDKAVSRWERGIGLPDISTLEPLSEALHITVLELLRSERLDQQDISSEEISETVIDPIKIAADQQKSFKKHLLIFCAGMLGVLSLPSVAVLIGYVNFPFQEFFQFFLPLYMLCAIEYPLYRKNQIIAFIIPIVVAFSGVTFGAYSLIIAAVLFAEYFSIRHMSKSLKISSNSADITDKK